MKLFIIAMCLLITLFYNYNINKNTITKSEITKQSILGRDKYVLTTYMITDCNIYDAICIKNLQEQNKHNNIYVPILNSISVSTFILSFLPLF